VSGSAHPNLNFRRFLPTPRSKIPRFDIISQLLSQNKQSKLSGSQNFNFRISKWPPHLLNEPTPVKNIKIPPSTISTPHSCSHKTKTSTISAFLGPPNTTRRFLPAFQKGLPHQHSQQKRAALPLNVNLRKTYAVS
jgi:hypothetical protein